MDAEKKEGRYQRLCLQLEDLLVKWDDPIANMATVAAVLHHKMEYFFWCGFYRLMDGELVVGPYQGPVACQTLKKDTGVCWAGVNQNQTIIVPDVKKFPGHIPCDSRSRSEIVVPVRNKSNQVVGVLDVDSVDLNDFDPIDARYLEKIAAMIGKKMG